MTSIDDAPMSDAGRIPVTGNHAVDRVLEELGEISELSPSDRLAKLAKAQDGLTRVLERSRESIPMPKPKN